MTATTPPTMEGTQAPSQIEYLYERYKHLLTWVLVAIVGAFAIYYGYKWQRQSQIDQTWTQFSTTIGLDGIYTSEDGFESLSDMLVEKPLAELEGALLQADATRAPFLLLAIARKAMIDRNWDRAESALTELEQKYPDHPLVQQTAYPVQVRENKEDEDKKKDNEKVQRPNEKPELEPAVEGSIVGRMRAQIAEARKYEVPSQFAMPEIPADAPKVKINFSGEYGSITIALMKDKAPKLVQEFLNLAAPEKKEGEEEEPKPFWVGLSVDEIQRPAGRYRRPMQFHLGFETTREADKTKWTKTDPSTHEVEFEDTGLSHFPGAVAARLGTDGKAAADRFYVCGEDAAQQDGQREVFGYVVEGLDNVKEICNAAMTAQEEESGMGVPTDNITVESVEILK